MKKLFLLALSSILLTGCNLTPTPAAKNQVLGTLELKFGSNDNPIFSAVSHSTRALTPKPDSSIGATFDSFVTRDVGSTRILTATYTITNNSGTAFNNLSLVAYAKTGNANSSALKNISAFNGTPSSTNVYSVVPAQGTNGNVNVAEFNSDLQIYTTSEADTLTTAARTLGVMTNSENALEYGFVARQNGTTHLRSIANGASGRVSLSMKIPTTADVSSGTRFVMTFIVADNNGAHVVQSPEEAANGTAAAARASAVGAGTQVRVFGNSSLSGSSILSFNSVTTAGTSASPLAWLFGSVLKYEKLGVNANIPLGIYGFGGYGSALIQTFVVPNFPTNITKVSLRVNISTNTSSRTALRVRLKSPVGLEKIMYIDAIGFDSGDNLTVTFDDASPNTLDPWCYSSSVAPGACTGTVRPIEALSAFNTTFGNGFWTVSFDDNGLGGSTQPALLNDLALQFGVSPTP